MAGMEYRLFLDDKAAKREQLDTVTDVTVEQEVDMAWEARLQIPVRVDDKGNWKGEGEAFMKSFSRIRVEIKVGDKPFIPLIDGPIVGHDHIKSAEPGQSSVELVIQDDSVYLNREEKIQRFEKLKDHEIAERLYREVKEIADTDIDTTPPPVGKLPSIVVQRGTSMQILRALARCQGMHAYVLPGDQSGQSVGCFKAFPTGSSGLKPLTLLGNDRNIETFNVTNDAQRPAKVQAFALRIKDKSVVSSTSSFDDVSLLGPEHAFEKASNTATLVSLPGICSSVDPDRRVAAEAQRASYALEASGSVMSESYPDVLMPYKVVSIRAVNERLSGDYMIRRVTHKLSRSTYSQAFTVTRNALSNGSSGQSGPPGNIF